MIGLTQISGNAVCKKAVRLLHFFTTNIKGGRHESGIDFEIILCFYRSR